MVQKPEYVLNITLIDLKIFLKFIGGAFQNLIEGGLSQYMAGAWGA